MLLRPDSTFLDKATNRQERVFPRGMDWLRFQSKFPQHEVFANSVLDPAIGVAGELGVRAFAAADWENWLSATKIGLYELGTRVGLPQLEKGTALGTGLALVYDNIVGSLDAITRYDNPAELIPELLKNAGLQVVQQLVGNSNMIAQTVAQVLAAAVWAFDVVATHKHEALAKNVAQPPMQTEDPATDSWQVNRVFEVLRGKGSGGIVYPDGGTETASNADYTQFYLPAYKYQNEWTVKWRAGGAAAQQGQASSGLGPTGADTVYTFDPGDASTFGFMPGTTTTLRVLQASWGLYHTVRGTPVDRYTLLCRGVNKPCYQTVKGFNGKRDCRQCVDAESVWPVKGLGWAYGGAPLNATTPGENVGAFYQSTNKLLLHLLEQIARPGPLLYTVDVERMNAHWRMSFEKFWEFARREWGRYSGYGWRGLISRLATLMTTFDHDGETRMGGRELHMPLEAIASPREGSFDVPFSSSIYSKIIKPFCQDLYRLQFEQLDMVSVAYIPPGVGALYLPNGRMRSGPLTDHFLAARTALLQSSRRMLVDLRRVSDPEYRAELKAAGVKESPVNAALHGSPGIGDATELIKPTIKPRRARPKPKIVRASPLAGSVELLRASPLKVEILEPDSQGRSRGKAVGLSLGLGVAAAGLTAASAAAIHRLGIKQRNGD